MGPTVARLFIWILMMGLVAGRLLLGSDLSVQISFAPHDDSLYVSRAFRMLLGETYGPYDSRILVKYPGISEWLAGMRWLGIPYLVSLNASFIGAGLYLTGGLLRAGVHRLVAVASFALYLFNPMTLGFEWIRVIREPIATCLLVWMLGAMLHIATARTQGRPAVCHLAVLALTFGFAVWVREDDRLLWGLLLLFAAAIAWGGRRSEDRRAHWAFVLAVLVVPGLAAKAHEFAARAVLERAYGLPIIHEFSEGEFPRLLGAIRSVRSDRDNRLVMVTQDALRQIRREVPEFRAVIDRLPLPGPTTFSCQLQGVCSEIANGWMPFFLKDDAYLAGQTPDLPAAQSYFRAVREAIQRACGDGRLQCESKGSGLVAPMELRWTRALFAEGWRLTRTALMPDGSRLDVPPVAYDVPLPLGRMYQAVTMTDYFDTLLQSTYGERPTARAYLSPIAGLRGKLADLYRWLGATLMLAALVALGIRLYFSRLEFSPVAAVGVVFGIFTLARLAALSYVAVYMGQFTSRMVFSTYCAAVFLALPFVLDTIGSLLRGSKSTDR